MSTRDKLFTILDCMTDEQLEGLYSFISSLVDFDEEPSEEMKTAIAEVDEMMKHPENYKSYSSAEEMTEDILNEVSD